MTTTVTPEAQTALGFDMAPYVQGSVGLVGGYTDPGDGAAPRATLAFDATEAELEIPELHWTKPAGAPGAVRVVASIPSEDRVVLTRVELETETLYALGRATLADGLEGVREITIETLRQGETDIAGRVVSDGDATRVSVRGASLDARPYFSRLTEEGAPEFGELVLDLAVERIVTTDDQQLTDFRARFETGAEGRHVGIMEGTLSTGARMSFSLEPQEDKRLITVRSRDAGAVARTFGIYDNAVGGELFMRAVVHDDLPGAPVRGTIRIEDYRVINAPTLARLLTIATLTGIVGELRGKGILFSRFAMPFTLEENILTIRDAQTSGFTVGVNAEGRVDLETDRVDMKGTIVPAYTFNTLIDVIPVLGELLTGGKARGCSRRLTRWAGRPPSRISRSTRSPSSRQTSCASCSPPKNRKNERLPREEPARKATGWGYVAAGGDAADVSESAAAASSNTRSNTSGVCAPETAYRPSKMKQGTPEMPERLAASLSSFISSTPSLPSRKRRNSPSSRPPSTPAAASTPWSLMSSPCSK